MSPSRSFCAAFFATLFCSHRVHAQIELGIAYPCPATSTENGIVQCSGHGICNGQHCTCTGKYYGPACSRLSCAHGVSWADVAYASDQAHNLAECSDRGLCDTSEGICNCNIGFAGESCERLKCPFDKEGTAECSGHGTCYSMRENGRAIYGIEYGDVWDADKIFGCNCDAGWSGYNCDAEKCPTGDDPVTEGQVDEVQIIKALLVQDSSDSFFVVGWGGTWSKHIRCSDSAESVSEKLNAISTLGVLEVTFLNEAYDRACGSMVASEDAQYIQVQFMTNFGDVDPLEIYTPNQVRLDVSLSCLTGNVHKSYLCAAQNWEAADGTFYYPVLGTKEDSVCAGRGYCVVEESAYCTCFQGFASSDGRGGPGTRGDCGYMTVSREEINNCVGELVPCSSNGFCGGAPNFECQCNGNYEGADCANFGCPEGSGSWFSFPLQTSSGIVSGHVGLLCSNRGYCNYESGTCTCQAGFEGDDCSLMSCPSSNDFEICSGHGICADMAELAKTATLDGSNAGLTYGEIPLYPFTWDSSMARGCICEPGYTGNDCNTKSCPTGHDFLTDGVPEIQTVGCRRNHTSCFLIIAEEMYLAPTELYPDSASSAYTSLATAIDACDADEHCVAVTTQDHTQDAVSWYLRSGTVVSMTNGGTEGHAGGYWTVEAPTGSKTVAKSSTCPLLFSFGDFTAETASAETIGVPVDVQAVFPNLRYSSVAQRPGASEYYQWQGAVSVTFGVAAIAEICPVRIHSSGHENPYQNITFIYENENGNLPQLSISQQSTGDVTLVVAADSGGEFRYVHTSVAYYSTFDTTASTIQDGSYGTLECSLHGICDYTLGQCACFNGWGDSDRRGNKGTYGDCGFKYIVRLITAAQAGEMAKEVVV